MTRATAARLRWATRSSFIISCASRIASGDPRRPTQRGTPEARDKLVDDSSPALDGRVPRSRSFAVCAFLRACASERPPDQSRYLTQILNCPGRSERESKRDRFNFSDEAGSRHRALGGRSKIAAEPSTRRNRNDAAPFWPCSSRSRSAAQPLCRPRSASHGKVDSPRLVGKQVWSGLVMATKLTQAPAGSDLKWAGSINKLRRTFGYNQFEDHRAIAPGPAKRPNPGGWPSASITLSNRSIPRGVTSDGYRVNLQLFQDRQLLLETKRDLEQEAARW